MAGVMAVEIVDYGKDITHWQERCNLLRSYENKIRKELSRIQESAVYIGYTLWDIADQGLYSTVCYQAIGDYCKNIFQYAYQELDMSKTTAFNCMAVAKEFSEARTGLKEKYRDYSFSQLVELLPMSEEAREYVDPRMTVKEIRALKRGENVTVWDEKGYGRSVMLPNELITSAIPTSEQKTGLIKSCVEEQSNTQKNSDVGTDTVTVEVTEITEAVAEPQSIPEKNSDVGTAPNGISQIVARDIIKIILKMSKPTFDKDGNGIIALDVGIYDYIKERYELKSNV